MSNFAQRVLTALVAIPIIVWICLSGGIAFLLFVMLVSAIALYEYYKIAEAKGAKPLIALGIIAGALVNLSFFHIKLRTLIAGMMTSSDNSILFPVQSQLLLQILLVSVVVLSLVELFRNNGSSVLNLATTLFGILYISFFFGTFIGLRELFVPENFPVLKYFGPEQSADPAVFQQVYRWGGYTVISVFAIIWICDSAAYHVGMAMGKHKLFPRVSPKKSWEGSVAGFITAIASAFLARYLVLEYLTVTDAIVIGIIVGVIGQLGDLVESLLKRDAGVKDSSQLIPGHGGAFDRFDSLLLVSPLVYLYLSFIKFS